MDYGTRDRGYKAMWWSTMRWKNTIMSYTSHRVSLWTVWASQLKQAYFCGSNDVLHMYFPCKNGLKILIFSGGCAPPPRCFGATPWPLNALKCRDSQPVALRWCPRLHLPECILCFFRGFIQNLVCRRKSFRASDTCLTQFFKDLSWGEVSADPFSLWQGEAHSLRGPWARFDTLSTNHEIKHIDKL